MPAASKVKTAAKADTFTVPKPVLAPDSIYSGDNGRLICLKCAGASAKFSGRDLSGHRVTRMARVETLGWYAEMNEPLACEGGCTTYPLPVAGTTCFAILQPGKRGQTIIGIGESENAAWADAQVRTRASQEKLAGKGCKLGQKDGAAFLALAQRRG